MSRLTRLFDRGIAWVRRRPVTASFVTLTVSAFAVLAVLTWAIHSARDLAQQNRVLIAQGIEAHDALCVFKADLARRMDETKKFLDDPPKTIFGIPVTEEMLAQTRLQLKGQQATFSSLSGLDCASDHA